MRLSQLQTTLSTLLTVRHIGLYTIYSTTLYYNTYRQPTCLLCFHSPAQKAVGLRNDNIIMSYRQCFIFIVNVALTLLNINLSTQSFYLSEQYLNEHMNLCLPTRQTANSTR